MILFTLAVAVGLAGAVRADSLPGAWRAVLDLAGGTLPFSLTIARQGTGLSGRICNGPSCTDLTGITIHADSVVLEMDDYAASITLVARRDSLLGMYRNVGNRGPRAIPFRAARGSWPAPAASGRLLGTWDATFVTDGRRSPRVFEFRNGARGLEASFQANSGDYGLFWGRASADSFSVAHFDGSFVYLAVGRLDGDTLRGVFHAGVRTQTSFTAVRSTGRPHLIAPTELTRADTVEPFRFTFPDLHGRAVGNDDPRFKGKVVLIDVFGTWCPTCHDAAPTLVELYREFHDQGLEVIGLAYEVSGDSTTDNRLIRRFREKFAIPYLLLRGGINDVEATAATLPQLTGFTAYPTSIFIGRDGRVKQVYAGFRGPATGAQYQRQVDEMRATVKRLLAR